MKRKNGFTLIELLAVIVILAIIAVIATPIIVGIIEDSRKAAFERSVEGIIHATDIDFGTQEVLSSDPYTISNGVLNKTLKTPIKNIDGFNGKIVYDEKGNSEYAIYNDKWCMKKIDGVITTEEYNSETCKIEVRVRQEITQKNGQPIYFDVVNGVGCKKETYDLSFDDTINDYRNSLTGYNGIDGTGNQNSCLKFYAYLYEEGDTEVKLLLDHNTTAMVAWNSSGSNATGPKTPEESTTQLLGKLKADTASWNGTKTPENYQLSQTTGGNYTIDYSSYKARLITAQEIAQITGADKTETLKFNESTTSNYFYFDSLTTSVASDCKFGNTSGCSYRWLYDRTATNCTDYGCENNSDVFTYGYWTSTSAFGNAERAWYVCYEGDLLNFYVYNSSHGVRYGVRPVIEVPVSNL